MVGREGSWQRSEQGRVRERIWKWEKKQNRVESSTDLSPYQFKSKSLKLCETNER